MKSFMLSLFPSFKYGMQHLSILWSVVLGAVADCLGLTPGLAVAMFVAVIAETLTGIKASKKRGEHFESFKFSRCILKLAIWLVIIYILHQFAGEMGGVDNHFYRVGFVVFMLMKVVVMVYFCIEYVTSILENLAEIEGKPKDSLVQTMWTMFGNVTARLTEIFKKKSDGESHDIE